MRQLKRENSPPKFNDRRMGRMLYVFCQWLRSKTSVSASLWGWHRCQPRRSVVKVTMYTFKKMADNEPCPAPQVVGGTYTLAGMVTWILAKLMGQVKVPHSPELMIIETNGLIHSAKIDLSQIWDLLLRRKQLNDWPRRVLPNYQKDYGIHRENAFCDDRERMRVNLSLNSLWRRMIFLVR